MRIRASTWVSLVILLFIPASWFVQYVLNRMMLDALMTQFGDKVLDHLPELNILFLSIPISQLVTLATIVIPSIFLRKAVREGTTNMTLPVGKHGGKVDEDED